MTGIAVLCMASCAVAGRVVYSTGFDTPDEVKGWTCNSVWKVEDGAGVGGSKAMVWTNSDGGKYVICNFPLQNAKAGAPMARYAGWTRTNGWEAPAARS